MQDLWAPRKLAIHLASPSKSRWHSISQSAGAGSILSPHSFASACRSLRGKSCIPQPWEKHSKVVAGSLWQTSAAALCFLLTGQHSSCPQPITHFIDATATHRHRPITRSGRQSNSPGFGSHSHYTGQGNPAASRLWDQAHPAKPDGNGQDSPKRAHDALSAALLFEAS